MSAHPRLTGEAQAGQEPFQLKSIKPPSCPRGRLSHRGQGKGPGGGREDAHAAGAGRREGEGGRGRQAAPESPTH